MQQQRQTWTPHQLKTMTYRQHRRYDGTKSHCSLLKLEFIENRTKNHEPESLPVVELTESYSTSAQQKQNDNRRKR